MTQLNCYCITMPTSHISVSLSKTRDRDHYFVKNT
jgi:hypothetical protein